jgi:hypothetical protein
LSALAADALAGLEVGYAGETLRALAGGLAELGARIADVDAPVGLLLVPVNGRRPPGDAGDSSIDAAATGTPAADTSSPSLDRAATGDLADSLTAAFSAARDGASRIRPGGCLLFVQFPTDPVARAAVASLTRTLALEWAPDLRVNGLACEHPADAVDLAALVTWPAGRTLTGAILDLPG